MRLKIIAFCLLLLAFDGISYAQSVYLFNYNFNSGNDTTSYSCLFFSYPDGTGLLKLCYKDPYSGSKKIRELSVTDFSLSPQMLPGGANKMIITTKFNDADTSKVIAPVFIFNENLSSGYYEPEAVSISQTEPSMPANAIFRSKTFARPDTLSKELAAEYFTANDPFILRYFSSRTRGGSVLQPAEVNIKMHLILVADTLNESIGYAGKADIIKIKGTFEQLSEKMGIKKGNFRYQLLAGKNFERKPILSAVAKLNPGPKDIVIFYYVGHGFRINSVDSFPLIKSTNINKDSATIVKNSIRIKEEIFDVIRKKNARFNLVISDCCNSSIEQPKKKGANLPKQRGDDTWELYYKNTRDLFLNPTASILITAAENGQQAICSKDLNSAYLSAAFVNSLKEYTTSAKPSATWKLLLEASKAGTEKYARMTCCSEPCCDRTCTTGPVVRCTQTSVYTIYYGKQ